VVAIKVSRHAVQAAGNVILREASNAVHVDFVLTELDLAITFCERALSTQDDETRERNIRHARKAYDAQHFLEGLNLTSAEQERIKEKASRLKGLFQRLGING
jgi:hypothetical protein